MVVKNDYHKDYFQLFIFLEKTYKFLSSKYEHRVNWHDSGMGQRRCSSWWRRRIWRSWRLRKSDWRLAISTTRCNNENPLRQQAHDLFHGLLRSTVHEYAEFCQGEATNTLRYLPGGAPFNIRGLQARPRPIPRTIKGQVGSGLRRRREHHPWLQHDKGTGRRCLQRHD